MNARAREGGEGPGGLLEGGNRSTEYIYCCGGK